MLRTYYTCRPPPPSLILYGFGRHYKPPYIQPRFLLRTIIPYRHPSHPTSLLFIYNPFQMPAHRPRHIIQIPIHHHAIHPPLLTESNRPIPNQQLLPTPLPCTIPPIHRDSPLPDPRRRFHGANSQVGKKKRTSLDRKWLHTPHEQSMSQTSDLLKRYIFR